ncbi:MAG: fumarylacetoacetate hydrolase family protein [Bdellovibrionota bacterium]|jgi:2-oxo-3-hexenedioate decarboxylase|nr:fumarylacetoacetate hydrolase family protein [Bdellovibrionota bacterium]
MTPDDINQWAQTLHKARLENNPIEQISDKISDFSRSDAYSIQERGIELRVESGEKLVGLKMGLTSEAKRKQMDLDSPLYGELTDVMEIKDGGTYKLEPQIHPKIEPEVAFLITRELSGTVTREEVLEATGEVYACMEILDSRYKQFKYFSMEDVISDNSSSSQFILGQPVKNFKDIDLKNLSLKMKVNGVVAQEGSTEAISGDPVVSVIQLCELLEKRGRKLPANSIVLAGAATIAVALEPGMNIELEMEKLGNVSVKVEE